MLNSDFITQIDKAYSIIDERLNSVKEDYHLHGIPFERISFEDIQLDDILQDMLLPLTPELIERSNSFPVGYAKKCYRVYVATLCELLKNGLVGGGINKTIEANIGPFDLNRHYKLIKKALAFEGIPILEKKRKYEETLINEAGIPRNYHRQCLDFFTVYWKWFHDYDRSDRLSFLSKFLGRENIDQVYIFDPIDKLRVDTFRRSAEADAFVEKATRTCEKLDRIYSALDSYPEAITDDNLDDVAELISASLGFNVFSVIRSSELRKYILDYAKKVSFRKFSNLMNNFPENEAITLPNGTVRKKSNYSISNYMGGEHIVRGTHYEVTFPCALSVADIFKLKKNDPYRFGTAVLYTSEDHIYAEENGYEKSFRTFYRADKGLLNVFYDRIKPATYLYIDDVPIDNGSPFSQKTYIGKIWDPTKKHYKLYLTIYELFYANRRNASCQVSLICNGKDILSGSTNQNGSFRVNEKNISLDDLYITNDELNLQFYVDNELIEEWKCVLLPLYLWNKQTGMRVYDEIAISEWLGAKNLVVFSRSLITETSIDLELQYEENGYYVYEGAFVADAHQIIINQTIIPIKKAEGAFIELLSDCTVISNKYCINVDEKLSVAVHGRDGEKEQHLLIEHEDEDAYYNLITLIPEELKDITGLIRRENPLTATNIGEWHISLFENSIKVSEVHVTVLPTIAFEPSKSYYYEDEMVEGTLVASDPCFDQEGEFVSELYVKAGRAALEINESVVSLPLDVSFYNDRCDVYSHLTVNPAIWALRVKPKNTDTWKPVIPHLSYDELKVMDYYVCTTKPVVLTLRSDECFIKKEYRQGIHFFKLSDLLIKPKKRSIISIKDEHSQEARLIVVYSGRVVFHGIEYESEQLLIRMKYAGPTGARVFIRSFSGSSLANTIERDASYNHFSLTLFLKKSEIEDPFITVEAKIDESDFETVCCEYVDVTRFPMSNSALVFTKNTSLIELLSLNTDSVKQGFKTTVIDLLERIENQ